MKYIVLMMNIQLKIRNNSLDVEMMWLGLTLGVDDITFFALEIL